MIKNEKSLNVLKSILDKLDDTLNEVDGAYLHNEDSYYYDEEIARLFDLFLEPRNRLQRFINLIEEWNHGANTLFIFKIHHGYHWWA